MEGQNPIMDIAEALVNNDWNRFQNLMRCLPRIKELINNVLEDPYYCRLLDLACYFGTKPEFVRSLLEKGANRNLINDINGDYPVHTIIKRSGDTKEELKCGLLKTLMTEGTSTNSNNKLLDLSVRDQMGNTALLLAVKEGCIGCVKELVNDADTDPNALNWNRETALHILLKSLDISSPNYEINKEQIKSIILLIRSCESPLKLSSNEDKDGKTVAGLRDELSDPELNTLLDGLELEVDLRPELVTPEDQNILSRLEVAQKHRAWNQVSAKLLMESCALGKVNVVEKLIELNVNPNLTMARRQKSDSPADDTAVMVSAQNGYADILKTLFETRKADWTIDVSPVNGINILVRVINGSAQFVKKDGQRDHYECLNYLLEFPEGLRYINCGDVLGNTPLHCAAAIGDQRMVELLLQKGADVAICNNSGLSALKFISPTTMETFLNRCVETNDKLPTETDYEITLNQKLLIRPHSIGVAQPLWNYDLKPLVRMNEIDKMSYLFRHPIITTFLDVKWKRIEFCFCLYFIFYFFLFFLYFYYSIRNVKWGDEAHQNETTLASKNDEILTDSYDSENSKSWIDYVLFFIILFATVAYFFLIIFASYRMLIKYEKNETILARSDFIPVIIIKLVSLIAIFVGLGFSMTTDFLRKQIAFTAIVLNSVHLVVILGMYPTLSTYLLLSKIVTMNFVKFLCYYCSIIITFAVIFSLRFYKSKENDSFLDSFGTSLFKVVLMMTGEFDLENVSLNSFWSRAVFSLFILVITMVLYNILNGLAIRDVQAIKSNAELFRYKFQTTSISYLEDMLLFNCKSDRARNTKGVSEPNLFAYFNIKIQPNKNCYATTYIHPKGWSIFCHAFLKPDSQVIDREVELVSVANSVHIDEQDQKLNFDQNQCRNQLKLFKFKISKKVVESAESIIMNRLNDDGMIKKQEQLDEMSKILKHIEEKLNSS